MLLVPHNWRDIHKYYCNTFIKAKGFGDKLFYIQEVSSKAIHGTHNMGKEEFILSLHEETPYELDYVLPNKSVFQYGTEAWLLYRVPAQQYCRGLSTRNTKICRLRDGETFDITWKTLTAFVEKPTFLSLRAATQRKLPTVALNSRMWFRKQDGTIWVDWQMIGIYSNDTLKCTAPQWLPELNALVAADPFPVTMV